jgi:hypothetical protein
MHTTIDQTPPNLPLLRGGTNGKALYSEKIVFVIPLLDKEGLGEVALHCSNPWFRSRKDF